MFTHAHLDKKSSSTAPSVPSRNTAQRVAAPQGGLNASRIFQLQKSYGNRAVQQLMSAFVQEKTTNAGPVVQRVQKFSEYENDNPSLMKKFNAWCTEIDLQAFRAKLYVIDTQDALKEIREAYLAAANAIKEKSDKAIEAIDELANKITKWEPTVAKEYVEYEKSLNPDFSKFAAEKEQAALDERDQKAKFLSEKAFDVEDRGMSKKDVWFRNMGEAEKGKLQKDQLTSKNGQLSKGGFSDTDYQWGNLDNNQGAHMGHDFLVMFVFEAGTIGKLMSLTKSLPEDRDFSEDSKSIPLEYQTGARSKKQEPYAMAIHHSLLPELNKKITKMVIKKKNGEFETLEREGAEFIKRGYNEKTDTDLFAKNIFGQQKPFQNEKDIPALSVAEGQDGIVARVAGANGVVAETNPLSDFK